MSEDWCTIESDPGVFTELISNFGVSNVQVDEIYSLDQSVEKSYGLIFLFKWRQETDEREIIPPSYIPELFFARQVINNACATQAMLSILLNSEGIEMGSNLKDFKDFTMSFDDEMKGIAISNSDMIRTAHNSFARSEPFQIEELKSKNEDGDAYHFIAFVPFHGRVYELDGLKRGPICLGEADSSMWLEVARPAIEERMARYSASETSFALLSLNPKKSTQLKASINALEERLGFLGEVCASQAGFGSVLNDGFVVGGSMEEVQSQIEEINSSISSAQEDLVEEEAKLQKQKEENVRRRHNYLPFVIKLIESLASKRKLEELIGSAQSAAATRAAEKEKSKSG